MTDGWHRAGLQWFRVVDDLQLRDHYLRADLLVATSRAEGFGLPIVEALAHGTPVLARDIPVFRELLGDQGTYFRHDAELADRILARLASAGPAVGVPERQVRWAQTAADLQAAVAGERVHADWLPGIGVRYCR